MDRGFSKRWYIGTVSEWKDPNDMVKAENMSRYIGANGEWKDPNEMVKAENMSWYIGANGEWKRSQWHGKSGKHVMIYWS